MESTIRALVVLRGNLMDLFALAIGRSLVSSAQRREGELVVVIAMQWPIMQ